MLWKRGEAVATTSDVAAPYAKHTLLEPNQLPDVFRLNAWDHKYGGEKWAIIAQAMLELMYAIDTGEGYAAESVCDRVAKLYHNTERLVPTTEAEKAQRQGSEWRKDKWPALCGCLPVAPVRAANSGERILRGPLV